MKITRRKNARVEVQLEDYTQVMIFTAMQQIKRHVDNVTAVTFIEDSVDSCSFCAYDWEVDEQGIPLCCDKAQEEWRENQGKV